MYIRVLTWGRNNTSNVKADGRLSGDGTKPKCNTHHNNRIILFYYLVKEGLDNVNSPMSEQ